MHHYSPMRMPPNHHFIMNTLPVEPVSRTYQYRKIMKPMLERKRRARINKCLDELKDLMTGTLQADGENVSKLEKADILELTVRHLHRLRENNALFLDPAAMGSAATAPNNSGPNGSMEKFWAGFQQCAAEVFQFMHKYDQQLSGNLLQHISGYMPSAKPSPLPPAGTAMDYQRLFAPVKMERFDNEQNISPLGGSAAHRPHPYQRPLQLERHKNKDYEPECGAGVWRPW